jgi:hypothetical protein
MGERKMYNEITDNGRKLKQGNRDINNKKSIKERKMNESGGK